MRRVHRVPAGHIDIAEVLGKPFAANEIAVGGFPSRDHDRVGDFGRQFGRQAAGVESVVCDQGDRLGGRYGARFGMREWRLHAGERDERAIGKEAADVSPHGSTVAVRTRIEPSNGAAPARAEHREARVDRAAVPKHLRKQELVATDRGAQPSIDRIDRRLRFGFDEVFQEREGHSGIVGGLAFETRIHQQAV